MFFPVVRLDGKLTASGSIGKPESGGRPLRVACVIDDWMARVWSGNGVRGAGEWLVRGGSVLTFNRKAVGQGWSTAL